MSQKKEMTQEELDALLAETSPTMPGKHNDGPPKLPKNHKPSPSPRAKPIPNSQRKIQRKGNSS